MHILSTEVDEATNRDRSHGDLRRRASTQHGSCLFICYYAKLSFVYIETRLCCDQMVTLAADNDRPRVRVIAC